MAGFLIGLGIFALAFAIGCAIGEQILIGTTGLYQ